MAAGSLHSSDVSTNAELAYGSGAASASFEALYEYRFEAVCRWARVLGAPASELEDLVQEVFIIAARKLQEFDGRNPDGWLFRITQRTVKDHRRSAWFRRVLRLGDSPQPEPLESSHVERETPLSLLERERRQVLLRSTLAQLSEKRRIVFELFELEGYSGEEISQLLDVPVATVWTRLHHARKQFLSLVERLPGDFE